MLELSSECLHRNGLVSILDVRYVWRKQREEYHEERASTGRKIIPPAGIALWLFTRDGISVGWLAHETLASEDLGDRWNIIGPRPTTSLGTPNEVHHS